MINWNNSSYGIKLPSYQVFNRKTGKVVKICDSPHDAKAEIERLERKKKK